MTYPIDCTKDPEYHKKNDPRIKSRIRMVEAIFNQFKDRGLFASSYINRAILLNCIESYYLDISRIKCFHNINLSDGHKKAAFSIKWLMKFRPIQLDPSCDGGVIKRADMLANEIFAVHLAMLLMGIGFEEFDGLSIKYLNNLFYNLHYREVDGMILSSMMYLLQKAINHETP